LVDVVARLRANTLLTEGISYFAEKEYFSYFKADYREKRP